MAVAAVQMKHAGLLVLCLLHVESCYVAATANFVINMPAGLVQQSHTLLLFKHNTLWVLLEEV